jgi:adhesin transport system outer membrane protein
MSRKSPDRLAAAVLLIGGLLSSYPPAFASVILNQKEENTDLVDSADEEETESEQAPQTVPPPAQKPPLAPIITRRDSSIESSVSKLFREKLSGKRPDPASGGLMPPQFREAPKAQAVAMPTASGAPQSSAGIVGTMSTIAPSPPTQSIQKSEEQPQHEPPAATPTPPPLFSAAPSLAAQNAAPEQTKPEPAKTVSAKHAGKAFPDGLASSMLKHIAGTDGIPLNIEEAHMPADVQMPIHLDEAVAFALKTNFEISAADEKSRSAFWDKMTAYGQYMPTVQVARDSGPERSQPASYNDTNGSRVLDSVHHRRDRSISITQPLIDLSIVADILSSGDKQEIAEIDNRDVREGIAFDTASAYLNLLQARLTVRLAEDYRARLEDLAGRMKARVDGGGASTADLDRIRGRLTTAEGARIEALGEYQNQLTEFKRLTKIIPPQLIIPTFLASPIPATIDEAMDKALRYNPTYQSSLKKIDLAQDDRNKSVSGMLPKLSFQYAWNKSYNAGGSADGNPADGVYPTQSTQNVMLVAQWSLNGGTPVTSAMASVAKEREMNFRSLDIRSRIEQGLRAGYASINAGRERQATLQQKIEADERVVQGFEIQFTNGGRSLFDLLDSYEQLFNSRLNFLRVTMATAKASYQVQRQMGELIPSIIRGTEGK